jgi:hypothetical protein
MGNLTGHALRNRIRQESSRIHLLDQPRQHAPNFMEASVQRRMLLVGEQSKIAGEEKEVFQLTRGAGGDMEKLAELRPAGSGASFRNIRRHRSCRSPHLAGNSESFVVREGHGCGVDAQDQCMTLLPDLELLKVLHLPPSAGSSLRIYLQLIANNCQLARGLSC